MGPNHRRTGVSREDYNDRQLNNCNELNATTIMMILIIILGAIFVLVAVIFILRCVCRKWFGRNCKIVCETSQPSTNVSSYAINNDYEDIVVHDSQPRAGKMSEPVDLPLFSFNRGFTPAPDDPIYTISQLGATGQLGAFAQNWEFGERIQPRSGIASLDQYRYTYDGQLRSPPDRSIVPARRSPELTFREDRKLQELCRPGMAQSQTITVGSKLVVFISREVSHLGDTLVLNEMGISLSIPPYAIEAGRTELISLILDWDLGDFPGMRDEETIISPVVHCGPHGLKLNKPAVLRYKHCAYDLGDVSLVASETHLLQTKDWREVCGREDRNKPYILLENEVQVQVCHFTLYTCLAEGKITTKKWMQLAVFGGKMRTKRHYEIRLYFLNNTPCALQFAIQNEAKNQFKLLCPRMEFLFHGDGEDILATIQHVSEGWSHRLDDRQERVPFLSLWHGKCPHVSFIFKHENQHVRDIDIRLVVNQRGREDKEAEKTNLKILASMRSAAPKHKFDGSGGHNNAVINVFAPGRRGKRRRYESESSLGSRSGSVGSSSSESTSTLSSVSSHSSSSSSSNPSSDTNTNNDATSKPREQDRPQSCTQNMQIHIHPSSASLPNVHTQRTVPHELCMELVVLLDPLAPLGNDWRILASALEMDSLIPLLRTAPSYKPTETLLEEIDRQDKSLEWLASVMVEAKRLDAANAIMKHARKTENSCTENEL